MSGILFFIFASCHPLTYFFWVCVSLFYHSVFSDFEPNSSDHNWLFVDNQLYDSDKIFDTFHLIQVLVNVGDIMASKSTFM